MTEKYYTLGTHTSEQWVELHAELIADGNTYESVPAREVTVEDDRLHSPTTGSYLLTLEEATALQIDERVKFINESPEKYPEIYMPSSEDLTCGTSGTPTDRYTALYNNWSQWVNGNLIYSFFTDVEPTLNRQGTFFRFLSFVKPNHYTVGKTNPFNTPKLQQAGAGENVDLIVPDNGCWLGHVEFISRGVTNAVNPDDYIGSNVLPGNGYCDVLDLVLDAPYYIDPNWFNADPTNRLMARWDGTIVPIESVAIAWWRDSTQRSISFASFGNIYVSPNYTRDTANGSNSTLPSDGTHGTQCAALAFGRTQGWAYNANKWVMNLFGDNNVGSLGTGLDVQKIFHIHKPVNPIYNSKDPTLSSNSWGIRSNKSGDGYYYWRTDSPVSYTRYTEPAFIDVLGMRGDGGRWKSELHDNSITQAGDELTQAGVICIAAAGNSGQQLVNPDHPNYDNHINYNNTTPLYSIRRLEGPGPLGGWQSIATTNRRGWPGHMGKTESQTFQGNTTVKFPVIQVGALESNTGSNEEKIADYSDRGPAIDLFSSGAGAMAATVDTYSASSVPTIQRVDGVYSALSAGAMDLSQIGGCRDTEFTGTSAACPVAAGFLASVMQYNRDWTYENLRTWIETNVTSQSTPTMYHGVEPTTPTDMNWLYEYYSNGGVRFYRNYSLQGAPSRVLYNAIIPVSTAYGVQVGDPPPAPTPYSISGSLTINGLTFSLFDANLL
jgi:hypothetical protein